MLTERRFRERLMKRFFRILSASLTAVCVIIFSAVAVCGYKIADNYTVSKGGRLVLPNSQAMYCEKCENAQSVDSKTSVAVEGYSVNVSLFGIIPIKTVGVTETESTEVAVIGKPFGLKIYTDGVLAVGYSDVETEQGTKNPAKSAGIKSGDTILSVNGVEMTSNDDLKNAVAQSLGNRCVIVVKRDGRELSFDVTPLKSKEDNTYKLGLWVRDSSAGIGMLTFYSPSSGVVAGLGHGICDTDTGELIPFKSGSFTETEIVGINKASDSSAGELKGVFSGDDFAELAANDETGVYGVDCKLSFGENVMPIALKQEITAGKAQIMATLDDGVTETYDCVIEKVYSNDKSKIKNMVIRITDSRLLSKTGGIVQGLSGSPLIKNGKLVGAVTHVFLNDSTRGYAIFAENMLKTAEAVGSGW